MKKIMAYLFTGLLILSLVGCSTVAATTATVALPESASSNAATVSDSTTIMEPSPAVTVTYEPIAVEYESEDLDDSVNTATAATITLEGDTIRFEGTGAEVNGSTIIITAAGTYAISGTLNDGQIIVNTQDKEKVVLLLNNASISDASSAPIFVQNAEKTVITLAEGTENIITDGSAYVLEAGATEPNAAIFSNDDLTINGEGALTVKANYRNGIATDDDLKITGGVITVNAVNDGLKGKSSIAIKDGSITVSAGGDGLRSDNAEDPEKGIIAIEGGSLSITSELDGIHAETSVQVSGGDITIVTGGGSANTSTQAGWGNWGAPNQSATAEDTASAKGIKATTAVTITGGNITIDSSDDALHANGSISLNGGAVQIASGDDGVHADTVLEVNGGTLNISQSYEGLESAVITLNDGTIAVTASDDGINTAGGADGSALGGRPGQNMFAETSDYQLNINGGIITVDAAGDGLDANGSINMTAGVVIVNGPTENMNGALDYLGNFTITGGSLIAVGSAGMAQAPSATSTQYSVLVNFASMQAAGTVLHIESTDGTEILTFVPTKAFQSVAFSLPTLQNGVTYNVYAGGKVTGSATNGLISDVTYTGGSQASSFTISGIVTGAGMGGGMMGGPGGGMPRPGGQRP